MPTKKNRAGHQQNYVPAGNGDASGEYTSSKDTEKFETAFAKGLGLKEEQKNSKPKLTKEQEKVISEYTDDLYDELNYALRNDGNLNDKLKSKSELLSSSFDGNELKTPMKVYRSMSDLTVGDIKLLDLLAQNKDIDKLKGKTFKGKSFYSTSLSEEEAYNSGGGRIMLNISLPKNTRAIPIKDLSVKPHENEVLVDKGYNYKITDVKKESKNHKTILVLECEVLL